MPPKRQLPPRGAQASQNAKNGNSSGKTASEQTTASKPPARAPTPEPAITIPAEVEIPNGVPFANHLKHAKKFYETKVAMILKIRKRRIAAARRLKKIQLDNIRNHFDFEMTMANQQGERAIELLNASLKEYVVNTSNATIPEAGVNGMVFDSNSNPFELTAAGQIPLDTLTLSSKHMKTLMQAQMAAALASNSNSSRGSGSRVTRGNRAHDSKDNLTDYSSDVGTGSMGGCAPKITSHTHISCASAFLTSSSNVMKRYQQLLLESKDKNGDSDGSGEGSSNGNSGQQSNSSSNGSRKRSSDRSAGASSSMYFAPNVPHFFSANINLALDDAACRRDMLGIITALRENSGRAAAAACMPTPTEGDQSGEGSADRDRDSSSAEVKNEGTAMETDGCEASEVAEPAEGVEEADPRRKRARLQDGEEQSRPQQEQKQEKKQEQTSDRRRDACALVRTSDRHVQIDNEVYYCGCKVDILFVVSNERLVGGLITAITPHEIVIKCRDSIRRCVYVKHIVTRRVVVSPSI